MFKEEITDLFRINIWILDYYKIIKSLEKVLVLPIKFMCLIIDVSYSAFFKYSKEIKAIDKRYRNDKMIKKRIMQIYLKSNRAFGILGILQVLWNENIKISYKTLQKYMKEQKVRSIIRVKNKKMNCS